MTIEVFEFDGATGQEIVRPLTDKEEAEFIVMAADAEPLEILLHLPLLCEDKVKNRLS
jgi:ribosomal protein L7Ae-like RNA K-turn-binding protein